MTSRWLTALGCALALPLVAAAQAAQPAPPAPPALPAAPSGPVVIERSAKADQVIGQLMSPFCPGLSLAACTTSQADSLRNAIRLKVEAGATPQQIVDEVAARFGEKYRAAPSTSGLGALAYAAPLLLLVVGAVMVRRFTKRATSTAAVTG